MDSIKDPTRSRNKDAKKIFRKLGTCSRTFTYLLNREFGFPNDSEERAADPLAGGIMQKGHQCGMLWGASLSVGAESLRRCKDRNRAIGLSLIATQSLVESFAEETQTLNCRDITNCDFENRWSYMKYMFTGKFLDCFKLAESWAPKAIESAEEGLSHDVNDLPEKPVSCASEVVRKMGGSDEEMVMVAGFSGGLGLSGHGCGALSAALWMNALKWSREHPGKSTFKNPGSRQSLENFNAVTDGKLLCSTLCGRHFKTVEDHSDFIKNGGCKDIIEALSRT